MTDLGRQGRRQIEDDEDVDEDFSTTTYPTGESHKDREFFGKKVTFAQDI